MFPKGILVKRLVYHNKSNDELYYLLHIVKTYEAKAKKVPTTRLNGR